MCFKITKRIIIASEKQVNQLTYKYNKTAIQSLLEIDNTLKSITQRDPWWQQENSKEPMNKLLWKIFWGEMMNKALKIIIVYL